MTMTVHKGQIQVHTHKFILWDQDLLRSSQWSEPYCTAQTHFCCTDGFNANTFLHSSVCWACLLLHRQLFLDTYIFIYTFIFIMILFKATLCQDVNKPNCWNSITSNPSGSFLCCAPYKHLLGLAYTWTQMLTSSNDTFTHYALSLWSHLLLWKNGLRALSMYFTWHF